MDIIHVYIGFTNIYNQMYNGTWEIWSKVTMIMVILVGLMKTFFFMRIKMSFSYIVTMIIHVISDL